jgi:hypothetical protein
MNKMTMMRGAAVMAILAFASVATAKTIQPLIWAPNYGSGSTFRTCDNTSTIWAQATGRDNNGVLVCFQRQFQNTIWGSVACPASATKHDASLRSVGNSYCTSPISAWGTLQFCSRTNFFMKVNNGACVNAGTVNVWSNAIN